MKHSIIKSSRIISLFTMLSRSLGMVRDILMAGFFGTGVHMSAFVLAFTIPNLFRRLFGEGSLSSAFIPVFVETKKREGENQAWLLARHTITLLATFLAGVVAVGILGITIAMRSSHLSEMTSTVLPLLRIMLPYTFFICLAALAMAILNSFRRFAVPAAMPCLLNIIWISTILFIAPRSTGAPESRIHAVAWAILIAGSIQLLGQLPSLLRCGYKPGFAFDVHDPKVRQVFTLMAPAAIAMAVTQINVLIDRLLAAWISDWAPAALFFSERLVYLPLGIFATAMGTVLLPTLSEHAIEKDSDGLRATLTLATKKVLSLLIPAAVGLFVLAAPIIQLLFEWKNFDAASTAQTAIALKFYAPGLIVFGMSKMLVPVFYAHQDMRTPVRLSVVTVGINLVLNIIFVLTWPTHIKHAGLAFGTVLAGTFYVSTLTFSLNKRKLAPSWIIIFKTSWRCIPAAVIMGITAPLIHTTLSTLLTAKELPVKIVQITALPVSIAIAAAIYFTLTFVSFPSFLKRENISRES